MASVARVELALTLVAMIATATGNDPTTANAAIDHMAHAATRRLGMSPTWIGASLAPKRRQLKAKMIRDKNFPLSAMVGPRVVGRTSRLAMLWRRLVDRPTMIAPAGGGDNAVAEAASGEAIEDAATPTVNLAAFETILPIRRTTTPHQWSTALTTPTSRLMMTPPNRSMSPRSHRVI